jgi:hypothetical protein
MNKHAQALARRNKGVKKTMTEAGLRQRREAWKKYLEKKKNQTKANP